MVARLCCTATVMFLAIFGYADAQNLTSSLGWTGFVQGISPLMTTITAEGVPAGTVGVSFYIDRYDVVVPLENLKIDYVASDGWSKQFDMGKVRPGATLTVAFLNFKGDTLGSVLYQPIGTIPRPSWLETARLSEVEVTGRKVRLQASYPIDALLDNNVPDDVTALGRRRFSLFDASANLRISYDLDMRTSEVSSPFLSVGINVFDQKSARREFPVPIAGISLDENFNLRYEVSDSAEVPLFAIDMPTIRIPIATFADLEFDAGVRFRAELKGRVVVGNEGAAWGFVRSGDHATQISASVHGLGTLQGGIRVLFGLASVRGILYVKGTLGGGIDYVSIPSSMVSTTFGGRLAVSGELRAKALFWTIARIGPKQLYETTFGTLPGRTMWEGESGSWQGRAVAVIDSSRVPEFAPQPSMDARNGKLGVVWVEQHGAEGTIWLSAIGEGSAGFMKPIEVIHTRNSPGSPRIVMMPDGAAMICWTQSRYTDQDVPEQASLMELLRAQDVWVAAYNPSSGVVGPPVRMLDDSSTSVSGRAEAEPRLCPLDNDHGLAVWMALSSAANGTDLWYSTVTRLGTRMIGALPGRITVPSGINRGPSLTPSTNGTAVLTWIHESAMGDAPTQILSSTWNGSQWSDPAVVYTGYTSEIIEDLTSSIRANRGVLSWISTKTDSTGLIEQRIAVLGWDSSTGFWQPQPLFERKDTGLRYGNPNIAVSEGGRAMLSWNAVPGAVDSADNRGGQLLLAMCDLANGQLSWASTAAPSFLSDTTSFVWDAQSAFADNDRLFLLTEERDESDGIRFGAPELGLTLRAMRLTQGLAVEDAPEPVGPVAGVDRVVDETRTSLEVGFGSGSDVEVRYRLPLRTRVVAELADIMGRRIAILIDTDQSEGPYRAVFSVAGLSPGVYFLRFVAGGQASTVPIQVR